MRHPLPPGFGTAILHMHVAADSAMGTIVGISHCLYYRGFSHYPQEITGLVADMRKAVDDLDAKLGAVEATLVAAPAVIEVAA